MLSNWRWPIEIASGMLTEAEGRALAEAAEGKLVLEIGSHKGLSTVCMAQTARVVHAVDHHKGDKDAGFGWTLSDLLGNLKRYRIENVIIHLGHSAAVGEVLADDKFDLVFIDGAHDYDSVMVDLVIARRVLKIGCILALHDWNWPEVRKAAFDVLKWHLGEAPGRTVERLYLREFRG